NEPWLFNFREAWLRMLALDFEGSVSVCNSMLQSDVSYPLQQPQTIAKIARGFATIAGGFAQTDPAEYQRSLALFNEVRDADRTPKFFLHWRWRMAAQLGLSEAWLGLQDLERARLEADGYLYSAFETADPHLQALAWEIQ